MPRNGACCLASLNLSEYVVNPYTKNAYFNFDQFNKDVGTGIEGLNEILDEGMELHALPEQRQMARDYRNVGLGIMGTADMFMKIGIAYGSEESKDLLDAVMHDMFTSAVWASSSLAKNKGSFPKYRPEVFDSKIIKNHFDHDEIKELKEMGLRNCSLLSIAPSGSIGTMLDVCTGIEPAYQLSYKRKTESLHKEETVYYDVYIQCAKEYQKKHKTDMLPSYFVASGDIFWKDRVDIQAVAQKHVDTAISSTVNLPENISLEDVEKLYLYAWEQGLKGITIFRENCKRVGILTSAEPKEQIVTQKLEWGDVVKAPEEAESKTYKFKSGCGNAYVSVTYDENGTINQTFTNKGSSGTCRSNQEAVSRLMSLALRAGVGLDKIIDQLKSVDVCPSYTNARAKGKPVSKGASCPHAIAYILEKAQLEIAEKFGNKEIKLEVKQVVEIVKEKHKMIVNSSNLCPECKEPLINEGHCKQCKSCGFSLCE